MPVLLRVWSHTTTLPAPTRQDTITHIPNPIFNHSFPFINELFPALRYPKIKKFLQPLMP